LAFILLFSYSTAFDVIGFRMTKQI